VRVRVCVCVHELLVQEVSRFLRTKRGGGGEEPPPPKRGGGGVRDLPKSVDLADI